MAQLVEHHLAKVRVAGSNPVVRSLETPCPAGGFVLLTCGFAIRVGVAVVPARPSRSDPVTGRTTTFCAQIVPGIVPRHLYRGTSAKLSGGRHHDASVLGVTRRCGRRLFPMTKRAATIEVDEQLLDALRRAAANDGVAPDDLVEEALRRYFRLRGLAVLDELGEQPRGAELSDEAATALAVAEVRAVRAERRSA